MYNGRYYSFFRNYFLFGLWLFSTLVPKFQTKWPRFCFFDIESTLDASGYHQANMVCVINDLTLELVTKNCHFQVICQMESERGVFNEHVFIPPEMKPHFQHDLFTPNFSRMQYVPNGIKVDLKSYEHDKQRESLSKDGDVIQDFLLYVMSSTFRNTVFLSVKFFHERHVLLHLAYLLSFVVQRCKI